MPKRSPAWVTSECQRCGKPVEHYRSQPRKYCSKACRWDASATYGAKSCAHCKVPFCPTHARQRWCVTCVPDRDARTRLSRYGVNDAEWRALVQRYGGRCWICRTNPVDCVDHDHETGAVRGALCRICNMALHYVERPGWWEAATAYLRR